MQPVKKHIITIAGRPGSGKSTTANRVAEELGYQRFSSGELFREMARQEGIDVLKVNLNAEKNQEIDYLVDEKLRQIGLNEDDKVVDSRLAWHWMPMSFKVFLDLDLVTAAERILQAIDDQRLASEDIPESTEEYAEVLKKRLESETKRYKSLYNIDPYDMNNYDLVIDTAKNNVEQVVEQILTRYRAWLTE